MSISKWEEVIEEKIQVAKKRGSKKRGWIKLDESYITSSINYRMTLEERAIWPLLILMAEKLGPVPGLISDNDFRPMPHEYLAHMACCPIEVFEATLKKSIEDDSIYENSRGIYLTHFDDYQFTEYDRQKPYREARKAGKQIHKVCPTCGYKAVTNEEYCPRCAEKGESVSLDKDYFGGKYGHMVQR